jgi:hypothetical protein
MFSLVAVAFVIVGSFLKVHGDELNLRREIIITPVTSTPITAPVPAPGPALLSCDLTGTITCSFGLPSLPSNACCNGGNGGAPGNCGCSDGPCTHPGYTGSYYHCPPVTAVASLPAGTASFSKSCDITYNGVTKTCSRTYTADTAKKLCSHVWGETCTWNGCTGNECKTKPCQYSVGGSLSNTWTDKCYVAFT